MVIMAFLKVVPNIGAGSHVCTVLVGTYVKIKTVFLLDIASPLPYPQLNKNKLSLLPLCMFCGSNGMTQSECLRR